MSLLPSFLTHARLINVVGYSLWEKSIGNVTGLVTKISYDLANMSGEFGELFTQFWAFVFGSLLSGLLVTARKAPKDFYRMSDRPVRRASIVLIIVAIFLFIGWAGTKHGGWKDEDNSVKFAPAFLAMAMGMQNGMTSKHAHAVIRTTQSSPRVATPYTLHTAPILRLASSLAFSKALIILLRIPIEKPSSLRSSKLNSLASSIVNTSFSWRHTTAVVRSSPLSTQINALRCPIHPRGFNDGFKGRVSVVWTRGLDVCWVEGCYSTCFSSL
jgi:hypothetical protein